jgi:putative transposase
LYLALGQDKKARESAYRKLFEHHVDAKPLEEITHAANKRLALGNERFKQEVESA